MGEQKELQSSLLALVMFNSSAMGVESAISASYCPFVTGTCGYPFALSY